MFHQLIHLTASFSWLFPHQLEIPLSDFVLRNSWCSSALCLLRAAAAQRGVGVSMTLSVLTAPLTSLQGTPQSSDLSMSLQDKAVLPQVFYKLVVRHREDESCLDHRMNGTEFPFSWRQICSRPPMLQSVRICSSLCLHKVLWKQMVFASHPQEMFMRMGFFLLEEKGLEIGRISFLIKKKPNPFLSKGSIWVIIVRYFRHLF